MIEKKNFVYFLTGIAAIILVFLSFRNQQVPYTPPKDKKNVSEDKASSTPNYNFGNIGNLIVNFPSEWIREVPSSSMRLAQYKIPNDIGNDVELAIFNKIGGSVEQNLSRWANQFLQPNGNDSYKKANIDSIFVSGLQITFMNLSGTFVSGGMMGGATVEYPDYAIHAAIVELSDEVYYFKMVGPKLAIDNWKVIFRESVIRIKIAD
tara:strand:- start:497 stop:1117 length:621 start_codon:yes stop_codon:yes gene_type:complete